MKNKLIKDYIHYIGIIFIIFLDALGLYFIGNNITIFCLYVITNIICIGIYCYRRSITDNVIFSILFMLFYTWFIDIFIHYLGFKVIFEAEFLFLVPLILTCIKLGKRNKTKFVLFAAIYILINTLIAFVYGKVDLYSYLIFMVNILTFICFYYIFSVISMNNKLVDFYCFLFFITSLVTILQTILGFHQDTRNGVFSVFGFGAYTIYIMTFISYKIARYVLNVDKLNQLLIALFICTVLYICTESKAAIVIMYFNIVMLYMIRKNISTKRVFSIVIGIISIPLSFRLLVKFYPRFSYLFNFNAIFRYFTGNNNRRLYEYGRIEALKNVFSDLDIIPKIIGTGFGSSTPLYAVFFEELGRIERFPYYIRMYGYNYGYQHTSMSTLLLDGGLILASIITFCLLFYFVKTCYYSYHHKNNLTSLMKVGVLVYLLYYFSYANILKDFRAMAITGIILGLNSIEFCKSRKI